MTLPFVLVRSGRTDTPLFAGMENGELVGIAVPDGEAYTFKPEEVVAAMSADPAAVYWGLEVEWARAQQRRAAERRIPAKGHLMLLRFPHPATDFRRSSR